MRAPIHKGLLLIVMLLGLTVKEGWGQSGFVVRLQTVDKNNQEPIADVELTLSNIKRTFTTDEKGIVSVLLPSAYYEIQASGLGIVHQKFNILIEQDTSIILPVTVQARVLEEVEVVESRVNEKVKHNVVGVETISIQQIQQLPMLAGEKDIVKSLTLLPGVQTGTEGSANLIVRGGTSDQNLYLLDQATLYHSGHLMGFLSSFNPLAIDSVSLYKGGFPAQFGGRLSAIIDTRVKEANLDSLRMEGNLGIISSKASIEIPIVQQRASLMLAGRRTYLDVFQSMFAGNNLESYSFYDLNGKGVYYFKSNHKVTAHYYQDRDSYFIIKDDRLNNNFSEDRLTWKNRVMGITWDYPLTSNMHNTLSLSSSHYGLTQEEVREQSEASKNSHSTYSSSLHDISLKNNIELLFGQYFSIDAGFQFERYLTEPIRLKSEETDEVVENLPGKASYQGIFYAEGHGQLRQFTADIGLRISQYWIGPKGYFNLEPRLNIKRTIGDRDALKLSYTRMVQPLHLLTDPGLGLPLNLWVSSDEYIAPQTSQQISGGYYTSFIVGRNNYSLSMEGYYKQMQAIVAYRDGYSSSSFTNTAHNGLSRWQDIVTTGQGVSYGTEMLLEKTSGRLSGWLAYTLSKTTHEFNELNGGSPFPSRFDRRHDLSLVGFYQLSEQWQLNANFSYATGQPVTLPLYTYLGYTFDYAQGIVSLPPALSYTQGERNSYRMKDFHRLDIAIQRKLRWQRVRGNVELGLFNVYNRKNPYYYYADTSGTGGGIATIKSVSLFPLIPSLSVSFSF